ncbi:peptidase S8/S53 domain-containing protein, partial [Syncephalis pseudoplumigaleata]
MLVSTLTILALQAISLAAGELATLESNRPAVRVHATGAEAIRLGRRDNSDDHLDMNAGRGYKIGIIDSGVDYLHPDLGGCFGSGCKIAYGYDFVGDAYTGMNAPKPDADPMDECNGHGTHVAGIIGANSALAPGVAPGATLGAYRVFGCQGSVTVEVLIAAMRRAAADGMDIINVSIGTGRFFTNFPDAVAAEEIARSGVVVVASAGNDGTFHMTGISSPAVAPDVISVASINPTKVAAFYFTHANVDEKLYYLSNNHISSFTSVFSSFGPTDNATNIKPDVAADGMQIFSTYPRKLGSYAILTGTSMAAP